MSRYATKFLFLIAFFTGSIIATAQEIAEPDYDYIRKVISNSRDENYYPNLMRRFVENDTTLTIEQYRNLYFGYTLQEDFVPYKNHDSSLTDARRRFTASKGDGNLAPEMIRIAQAALEDNPFDIPAINIIATSYLQIGDTIQYKIWYIKQEGILDAIKSTGDGAEPESAFHVIDIEHEYEILQHLGLKVVSNTLVNDHVEYLKVNENPDGDEGFYFNFGACREVYKKKYE